VRVDFPLNLRLQNQDPIDFQTEINIQFPNYERLASHSVHIRHENASAPEVVTTTQPHIHKFSSQDQRTTIELAANFITFAVVGEAYLGFETTLKIFQEIFAHAQRIYRFPILSRIGLRKVGRHTESGDWNQESASRVSNLFNPALTGTVVSQELGFDLIDSVHRTSFVAQKGVKSNLQYGVQLGQLPAGPRAYSFFLDIDCFTDIPTQVEGFGDFLTGANDIQWQLYNWAITEQMRGILRNATNI
jgi:uncharacterized protein (TIGR04255 family)